MANLSLPCDVWAHSTDKDDYPVLMIGPRGDSYWYRVCRLLVTEWYGIVLPKDWEPDHLCKNHRCWEPAHLEPVHRLENIRRGDSPSALNARKTHCLNGHPFNDANTYISPRGRRECRPCCARRSREWEARRGTAA